MSLYKVSDKLPVCLDLTLLPKGTQPSLDNTDYKKVSPSLGQILQPGCVYTLDQVLPFVTHKYSSKYHHFKCLKTVVVFLTILYSS